MNKTNNRYTIIKYVIDTPIIGLSYLLATSISNHQSIFSSSFKNYWQLLVVLLVWYFSASLSRLYAERRSNKYSEEIVFIVYTLIIYTVVLSSVFYFLRDFLQQGSYFFLLLVLIQFGFLTFTKYIIRKYIHSALYQGKLLDSILIVGATPSAMDFYETINKYYYYGYKCVGFLDDRTTKMNGCLYHGSVNKLSTVLQNQHVDEVLIALPGHENETISKCVEVCDYYTVKTRIIPDFHQYTSATIQVNNIGLLPVINIRSLPLDKFENKLLKSAFDITFASIFFLTIGIWLFPLIALSIKLSSRGPVFFKQERWGLNNEKITCYKFRTMVVSSTDINEKGEYQQAIKNDSRITPFGAFLRRSNLDELPQFWNVLLGNMSVVGPRPHPTPLNIESMHTVENYMLRHIIKPGITGWAQVNGCRGETVIPGAMQRRVNFDLYYIHRWTFWLDGQIILQTIINMLRGDQNAY